ncbi:hypothetical protein B5C34_04835 [Pacificimonas flava]|uniref:4-hydroxyacetophenone monooxygenase n=2 Tax=Pacificimonas TaxID=1960290 RepID=A0A219B3E7_9SPHN|nr:MULTISPECIES: NAD(P)/FAD-dependent oxidoreductase [Pacificimonas]MBZ6377456.1 NAD(P)-binding domain-containing protein [Pacificimonas aurantium]OWV32845.1 hypothetical protein B5C34_04835 [Pacificimonas flava]
MLRSMTEDISAHLQDAHIPSLVCALVHMTGDTRWLEGPQPVYDFFGDGQGDLPPHFVDDVRNMAAAAMERYCSGAGLPPQPAPATIRRMMDFIAGAEIPEDYVSFLTDELRLEGGDTRKPEPVRTPQRVAVIGAGMSGLLAAIRLVQAGHDVSIIEKNEDVGGTWLENRYPGVRVDTPNHLYSYSFEANHDWPQHYSTGDVLLSYFQRVADKYDLRPLIRFGTSVEECVWDEARCCWTLHLSGEHAGTLDADAVVSAVGQLNQPRYPEIEGRDSFAGTAFHSARWPDDVELSGKRVAVIGTGASAFQFVPEIAPEAEHLSVFQRTPPWLGPTENYHDEVSRGKSWLLEHVPFYERWYRFWLNWTMTDGILDAARAEEGWNGPKGTIGAVNAELREALVGEISKQVADKPELLSGVVPEYPIGGKRSLRDNGVWIDALKRPDVDLVEVPIARITATGIETEDGVHHDADVLIYGTGFRASDFLSGIEVRGREGHSLHDRWQGDARAYLGMTVPDFPNFFMLYGPNTNIVVNGSIIFFSECSVRYVVGALAELDRQGAAALDVKHSVHDRFNERVDAENEKMAWGQPGVSSWYKNAKGRVSQNWPFRLVDYWNATLAPDPEDFDFTPARPLRQAAE